MTSPLTTGEILSLLCPHCDLVRCQHRNTRRTVAFVRGVYPAPPPPMPNPGWFPVFARGRHRHSRSVNA